MNRAQQKILANAKRFTRTNDQELVIPENMAYDIIQCLQSIDMSDVKKLVFQDKFFFVEFILLDLPVLLDPYSHYYHIYAKKLSWHDLIDQDSYAIRLVDFFFNALKVIIDHPFELLINEEYFLICL